MRAAEQTLGLYVHIPFCRQKCSYCDFYSLPHSEGRMDDYTAVLLRQLREDAPLAAARRVDTVYIGGGTPSYLGARRLCAILETIRRCYRLAPDAELTLEANPDSACDVASLRALREAGYNRLSLGVQSADDELLRRIGRVHTFRQVQESVAAARAAGFGNVSMDLIYGLPGQTMAQWADTLTAVLALGAEHLSCYGLKLEEGTPLWQRRQQETFPDEDQQAELYLYAVDTLARHGLAQYEISNFARPGFASRHNRRYWRMEEYRGFGPGAHSDMDGVRFAYARDMEAYLAGRRVLSEWETEETLSRDMEYLMLFLRTVEGIDRGHFEALAHRSFAPLETLFRQYAAAGLAAPTSTGWRLTPKGFLVSNAIIVALELALEE